MNRKLRRVLVIFAVLFTGLCFGPLLVPVQPLQGTVPPEQLADQDSLFIEANGLQLHYKDQGGGEPALILLHGFLASTFSWREVLAPLGEGNRVIAFDRPAFGLTQRPLPGEWQGLSPYSASAQADITVALMDQLGLDQAVLVGHSAGGAIATLTALRYPERIRALVLEDAAIYRGGTPAGLRPLLSTPQMQRLGPLLVRSVTRWGVDFGRRAWHDSSDLTEEIWAGYTDPLRAEHWDQALWEFIRASRPPGLADRLGEVRGPVLVITGIEDRIVPSEESIRLAEELPEARLVVIPACGHVPHEECPQAFLRAVRAFLNDLPPE